MPSKRIKILLVILGLFMLPFLEITSIQPAMAEEFEPPTLSSEGADGIDENVGSLIQEAPPVTANSHDTINSELEQGVFDGQLPERVLPPGSVEVLLPASMPPGDDSAITSSGYQSRPEGSYIIQQQVNSITGPDILLLHSDWDTDGDSPIQGLLQAYGDLGDVDMFNFRDATPTLAQLQDYQVVITWVNNEYLDPVGVGNVLADYVDLGGKVINLNFSMGVEEDWGVEGWPMGGRFMTENYTAMNGTTVPLYSTQCLGDYNASSPIMFGITNVCDYWRIGGTYLTPDSSVVAEWGDGEVFVAAKDNRSVVTINGYIGKHNYVWTGLMPDVVHNAIWWVYDTTSKGSFGWDNGPLVTHPGDGSGGADASALQSGEGMTTFAFGNQLSYGNRMADDFEVTDPAGWQMDLVTFFAYQWGSTTTSTITGVYYQIWDGPPDNPGSSVVFGDLTTNRLVNTYWSNIYRVSESTMTDDKNPIMTNVVSAGVTLPPGTYWLDWMTDGSLTSGPWAPPISINGETTTGNAMQYTTGWAPALDAGTGTQQGMPFILQGYVPFSLWNQSLSVDNHFAVTDQDFPDIPTYSSFLADDFYVHTPWKIETVFVPGSGWSGFSTLMNATALNFMVYADDGGRPAGDPSGGSAPPIWTLSLLPTDPLIDIYLGTDGYPSNALLTLPEPLTLSPGRYWLIFYPEMLFTPFGQYGRQSADTTYGVVGQFINPGDGWGHGTGWQDWTSIEEVQYDIAFRLGGPILNIYLPLIMK